MATQFRMYTANASTPAVEFPGDYEIEANINFASLLNASCSYDWLLHASESLKANPWQLRTYLDVLDEDQHVFRGYIDVVDRQHPTVQLQAKDKLGILAETLCRYDTGDGYIWNIWARWSDSENVGTDGSPIRLYPSAYASSTPPYNIWYPKYDSAAYYAASASVLNMTLTANFSSGDAEIDIGPSVDAGSLPPEGFVSLTHGGSVNMIQYQGKAWDEVNATYKIYNCHHGRNGSTSTAGSIGEVVYYRPLKRIHFDRTPRIRGFVTSGSVYEAINPDLFDVLAAEGGWGFKTDPLNLRRKTTGATAAYDEIRAVYDVYAEEDGTKQLLLSDVLTAILAIHAADFGPEVTCDIDISPDIVLTRVECPRSMFVLEFIRQLLSDIGLLKGNTNDALAIWYDPQADTVCIKSVAQLAATDASVLHYTGEKSIQATADMENVYSAVSCDYESQSSGNYLASRRVWHTVGAISSPGPYIFHLANGTYQQTGASYGGTDSSVNLLYPNNTRLVTLLTAAGNSAPELIMDGNSDTGFALGWDNEADATDKTLYFWFSGVDEVTPDSRWIGEVGALLDMAGEGPDGATGASTYGPRYEIMYFDDLAPNADSAGSATVPSSSDGAKYLDSRLGLEYTGGTITENARQLSADNMLVYGNGIAIKIHTPLRFYPSGVIGSGRSYYGIKIKDIWVRGPRLASTIFALRASYSTGATNYLTAPDSYDKITGYLGKHKIGIQTISGATKAAADYLAFLALVNSLVITATEAIDVTDKINLQWHGCPALAKTAVLTDIANPRSQITGVIYAYRFGRRKGQRYISGLSAVDFNAGIFGQAV